MDAMTHRQLLDEVARARAETSRLLAESAARSRELLKRSYEPVVVERMGLLYQCVVVGVIAFITGAVITPIIA